eukprot:TRINITY_DN17445_c0_g1_i2.p1 TRINITY_DN17445_c0_g1~~TRINITY_DN17445_c0_g1_i2.p1  ORF type:complete len:114 (-),score=15.07 TRINITY_DN17445_c0_g1_i2:33-374(-)
MEMLRKSKHANPNEHDEDAIERVKNQIQLFHKVSHFNGRGLYSMKIPVKNKRPATAIGLMTILPKPPTQLIQPIQPASFMEAAKVAQPIQEVQRDQLTPVSYTHLTLPTIYSV